MPNLRGFLRFSPARSEIFWNVQKFLIILLKLFQNGKNFYSRVYSPNCIMYAPTKLELKKVGGKNLLLYIKNLIKTFLSRSPLSSLFLIPC